MVLLAQKVSMILVLMGNLGSRLLRRTEKLVKLNYQKFQNYIWTANPGFF